MIDRPYIMKITENVTDTVYSEVIWIEDDE
jgi:hypothetical protein